jgi:hypothetical protein
LIVPTGRFLNTGRAPDFDLPTATAELGRGVAVSGCEVLVGSITRNSGAEMSRQVQSLFMQR